MSISIKQFNDTWEIQINEEWFVFPEHDGDGADVELFNFLTHNYIPFKVESCTDGVFYGVTYMINWTRKNLTLDAARMLLEVLIDKKVKFGNKVKHETINTDFESK